MLSTRFKYVIGIGVGAGAYVLAKFAVSLPPPTPSRGPRLPSATGTFALSSCSFPSSQLALHLENPFAFFSPKEIKKKKKVTFSIHFLKRL